MPFLVVAGMDVDEVVHYTMHSLRHVYPTCGFQLMFPPPAVTLMGHWATKEDHSASTYDAARVSTELAYKANVAANVHRGWRPVEDGAIPQLPLVPLGVAEQVVMQERPVPLASRPKKRAKKSNAPAANPEDHRGVAAKEGLTSKYVLPEAVVQVINTKTKLVHLYNGSKKAVACSAWSCGTPGEPGPCAEFAGSASRWNTTHAVRFCINCHSVKAIQRMDGQVVVDNQPLASSDSSSSGSSGSSSS